MKKAKSKRLEAVNRIRNKNIFFVDGKPASCKTVSRNLKPLGLNVSCFSAAADCLKRLNSQLCNLLITDMKLPQMNGIELLKKVKRILPALPVIIITSDANIPTAVRAVKEGAYDFIAKPLNRQDFLVAVKSALGRTPLDRFSDKMLTKTELKVLRLVLDGKSNKQAAALLHRSIRTVEDHRSHIMRKFDVDNLVDLVKKAAAMGFVDLNTKKQ